MLSGKSRATALLAGVCVLFLCPPAWGQSPGDTADTAADKQATQSAEPARAETVEDLLKNLGDPLVRDPKSLERLDPTDAIWLSKDRKHVVMIGLVCARNVPLEHFACRYRSKEHESILMLDLKGYVIHAGLLAAGAEPGNPVLFYPEYKPATGTEIEISLVWKDEEGKKQRARAQDWIRKSGSQDTMEQPFVFGGSQFLRDEVTGRERYLADGTGDFFCVTNFSSAILDIPIPSSDSNSALLFHANTRAIPPLGTRVTLILTPKPKERVEAKPESQSKAKGKEAQESSED